MIQIATLDEMNCKVNQLNERKEHRENMPPMYFKEMHRK
jgi:hypothetical protein